MEFLGLALEWWIALALAAIVVVILVNRGWGPTLGIGSAGGTLIVLGLILLLLWWVFDVDFLKWLAIIAIVVGAIVLAFELLIWWVPAIPILGTAALVLLAGLIILFMVFGIDDDDNGVKLVSQVESTATATAIAQATATPENLASISGRVVDNVGQPVRGATVRISGPYDSRDFASDNQRTTETNENGEYRLDLPISGLYDIHVTAENQGFLPGFKVGGQEFGEVTGKDFVAPEMQLKKPSDFAPARDDRAFVFTSGVPDREAVTRSLLSQGYVNSSDDIVLIEDTTISGEGRTTVRDTDVLSNVPTVFRDEPVYRVEVRRPDGVTEIFVEKKCGNIAAPPGKVIPPPLPPPPPSKPGPTATPVPPGQPTPTNTPVPPRKPTNTPVPPRATPTLPPPPAPSQTPQPRPTTPPPCCPNPAPTEEPDFPFVTQTPVRNPSPTPTMVLIPPTPRPPPPGPTSTPVACTFCPP